jgi:hypothetical protein
MSIEYAELSSHDRGLSFTRMTRICNVPALEILCEFVFVGKS